jgi:LmbE family N-acetylglucosaminyl deacetylase
MHVVVLSPHRDDAAFSCGLLLNQLLAGGNQVTGVNVFNVSSYAPYLPLGPDDRTQQVSQARQAEDLDFAASLLREAGGVSASLTFVDMGWFDLPLRWDVNDEQALSDVTLPLAEQNSLTNAFRELPRADIVLAPMSLGGHIDHRLVSEAAKRAFASVDLVFYEDLPYACRAQNTDQDLGPLEIHEGAVSSWLPGHRGTRGLKRRFALCYPSQISPEVAEEMETYAAARDGNERYVAGTGALSKLRSALPLRVTQP